MKKLSKSLLMTALVTGMCIGGVQGVSAAENPMEFNLDEYVVTATRTQKNLFKVPANVSVVTAKDIQDRNIQSVREALKQESGIYMDEYPGATGGIEMRGMGSDNILIMMDGQPLNGGWNGTVAIESIPIEQIERIEVVRGAGSSLYGGRAVAGVINIISKKLNEKTIAGNVIISGGSNDTWKKAIDVRGKINDKWSFGVGYENRETDGVDIYRVKKKNSSSATGEDGTVNLQQLHDDDKNYLVGTRGPRYVETESFNTSVQYNFDEEKSLKYSFVHNVHEYGYSNPVSYIKDSSGNPVYSGSFTTQNGDKLSVAYKDFISGSNGKRVSDTHLLNYNDSKNLWSVNLGLQDIKKDGFAAIDTDNYTYNKKEFENGGPGEVSYYPAKNYNLDIQKTWENIGKHTITAGANWKEEEYTHGYYACTDYREFDSKYGEATGENGGKTRTMSVFVQDEYKINEPLTLYVGGRYDYFKKFDGYNEEDGNLDSANFNEFSPKVTLEYAPTDDITYYASYGHSFNTPILYQLYRTNNSTVANPELKPEISDTYEIGVKKKFDKTTLGLTFYQIDSEDTIYSVKTNILKPGYDEPGTNNKNCKGKYINGGDAERRGIEFEIQHQFDKNLNAYLNYAWQKASEKKGTVPGDITDIPRHLLHFGLDYNKDKFGVVLDAQYVSERQAEDKVTGEYGSEDAYFVMNTYFNYKITPQATLQFGIQNILDREYFGGYSSGYACSDGRLYNVSLRYSF